MPLSLSAIEKLKSPKTPGIDQIRADLIKAGGKKFAMRSINLFFYLEQVGIS